MSFSVTLTSQRIERLLSVTVCALTCSVLLSACVTEPSLYRWGAYEDIIYTSYRNPGLSNPVADAELLAADMERTEAEGFALPPGVRIHLGYLYAQQGRDSDARALFEQEREAFPESREFVDGLLRRLGGAS